MSPAASIRGRDGDALSLWPVNSASKRCEGFSGERAIGLASKRCDGFPGAWPANLVFKRGDGFAGARTANLIFAGKGGRECFGRF